MVKQCYWDWDLWNKNTIRSQNMLILYLSKETFEFKTGISLIHINWHFQLLCGCTIETTQLWLVKIWNK